MKAYRITEINFRNTLEVDFQKDKKLLIIINALSFVVFVIFYVVFDYITRLLSINNTGNIFYHFETLRTLPVSANIIFIVGLLLILSVHELIHGFFFLIYTKEKPVIGFKSVYAYAGAPGWFIKKNYFQVITLSPLIVMTFTGFLLLGFLSPGYASMVFLLLTVNAAGSVGDIWVSFLLFSKPEDTYINDSGISARICDGKYHTNQQESVIS